VERIRKRFVSDGIERALNADPQPGQKRKLDWLAVATLNVTTWTEAPEGHVVDLVFVGKHVSRVGLSVIDTVVYKTVRLAIKKNKAKPWQLEM
jgi:hypothetical protein